MYCLKKKGRAIHGQNRTALRQFNTSGQIIATSHDLGSQKAAFGRETPKVSGKSRLVKYYSIWPDIWWMFKGYKAINSSL